MLRSSYGNLKCHSIPLPVGPPSKHDYPALPARQNFKVLPPVPKKVMGFRMLTMFGIKFGIEKCIKGVGRIICPKEMNCFKKNITHTVKFFRHT